MTAVAPSDRRIAAGIFLLAAVAFAWFFGGAGWNQDAHFDLTRALVEQHTLHIDAYEGNTSDTSRSGGHVYINKPPGVSFLAAVPYFIVEAVEKSQHAPLHRWEHTNAWIVTAATCGLCGAAIGPVLYLYGRRRIGATRAASLAVSLLILFGTIVFAYSTMLFAHVPAALFLLLALTLVREHPLAAGAAAGMATTCFYVCGLGAAIIALMAVAVSGRAAARFVAGGVPFAILLGLYQWRCFGSPLRTATEASSQFTEKGLLFGVFRAPSLEALYGISFSPYRGLFFASPVLLFAIAGAIVMARRRELRPELFAVAAITLGFFVTIAGFNGWSGGWAFGPRYVLPVIPLLGIPMLAAATLRSRALRALWIVAASISLMTNFAATATDPMPSPELRDPVRRYLVPAFLTGRIPEQTRLAFPWYHETRVDKVALPREAANLGELVFGKGRRATVVPVALWMMVGSALLFRAARAPD